MSAVWVISVLLAGCGGSSPEVEEAGETEDPRLAAFAREREALEAERPEEPMVDGQTRVFSLPPGCGQGPYRVRVDALGAAHRERVRIYACTPRTFTGTRRLHVEPWEDQTRAFGRSGFGNPEDSARCAATATERASGGGSHGGGSGGASASGRSGATGAEPAAEPALLEPIDGDAREDCGRGRFREPMVDSAYTRDGSGPVIEPGTPIELVFWSELPIDFTDVTLVVDQDVVRPDLTDEEWRAYYDAENAWYDRYRELVDREVAAGTTTLIDDTPRATEPPPAPRAEARPPRPSDRARWIAGYWHHETRWTWIGGLWRVPQIDIDEERVVRAPTPPPAARAEATGEPPARDAVWAPGYWQWNGGAYVWVEGAWRIPPTAAHTWRPDAWLPRGSVTIFAPGGWTLGR